MEELLNVLAQGGSHEFPPLFDIILGNLRARDAVTSSEDLLRLRAYENLQKLLILGGVSKTGKIYTADLKRLPAIEKSASQRSTKSKSHAARAKAKA